MEKTGYVILPIGWEYNDEVYHTGNYGETYEKPTSVILNKEKAQTKLKESEINHFKGTTLGMYGYGADEFSNDPDALIEFFNKEFDEEIEPDGYSEFGVPSDATDDQIERLMKIVTVRFYEMVEVEIEE